nr:ORF1; putative [Solanum lycopersicum]
MDIIKEL